MFERIWIVFATEVIDNMRDRRRGALALDARVLLGFATLGIGNAAMSDAAQTLDQGLLHGMDLA